MAIIKMKKMHLIMPYSAKDEILGSFTNMGCVEVKDPNSLDGSSQSELLKSVEKNDDLQDKKQCLNSALDVLTKYVQKKTPFLIPKPSVSESDFLDENNFDAIFKIAENINMIKAENDSVQDEIQKIESKLEYLRPWSELSIPLSIKATKNVSVVFATCSATSNIDMMINDITSDCDLAFAQTVSSDEEKIYLVLLYHNSVKEEISVIFKENGISKISFNDEEGNAEERINKYQEALDLQNDESEALVNKIIELYEYKDDIQQAIDNIKFKLEKDETMSSMLRTDNIIYTEAWIPEKKTDKMQKFLDKNGCVVEFSDPQEDDDVPVLVQNYRAVSPFSAITEMYGVPTRESLVDSNILVAVFFTIFFGMMLGDAMYGLILFIFSMIILIKKKPTGTFRKFMFVAGTVGLSAVVFGVMFSSFFGNFLSVLGDMLGININMPPSLLDPLADPMSLLAIAIAIGVINLFAGMWLAAWRMIRQGNLLDAICDIFFWYLIIGGLIIALVGSFMGLFDYKPGLIIAAVGAVGVILTGGRHKPSAFGKIFGGLSSLYGITGYLSDILSYSRLMALGLATGVVAQVINSMGTLAGNSVLGWILFILVFLVGQTFNLFIGLLGAFVHSCRLIYVEFFGKFFEAGGRTFSPLDYNTQYVHIIKEEK